MFLTVVLLAQMYCHNPDGSCYPVNPIMPCQGLTNATPCEVAATPTPRPPTPTQTPTSPPSSTPTKTPAQTGCCIRDGVCQLHNPIFGTCTQPCNCSTVPTATPTAAATKTPVGTPTPTYPPSSCGDETYARPLVTGTALGNYIQGPSPVKNDDGTITMVLDWGKCCLAPTDAEGGERIGTMTFPIYGPPFFQEKFNSRNATHGHEAAYPSVVKFKDGWIVAYSSTLYPEEGEKIGTGFLWMKSLHELPYKTEHRAIVTDRNHWANTLVWKGNTLYLYTTDEANPTQPVVRYTLDDNLKIVKTENVKTPHDDTHRALTDVAAYPNSGYIGLMGQNWNSVKLYVVESPDGLTWTKKSELSKPGRSVFDGGFLRDGYGKLIEPIVVWANAIPTGAAYTDFDKWSLVRWGDAVPSSAMCACATYEKPYQSVPTFSKTGLEDFRDRPLTMSYQVYKDYCIYIHHDNGPWMGKETIMCGYGGPPGISYTDVQISLRGCGENCQVPPHKVSVTAWGIYNVSIYNASSPRPVIP